MRALVLKKWWTMTVAEVDDVRPDPGETLVEVLATGICGSDLHGYTGENGRRHPGQVMGHETVARVLAHGGRSPEAPPEGAFVTVNPVMGCQTCESCRRGEGHVCPAKKVIGVTPEVSSAFAERMVVPTRNLVALPEHAPWALGALVEPLSVGYHAVRRGGCGPGESVLVIGGGPIGQACVLAAWRLGARAVVVSETSPVRRGLLSELGACALDPAGGESTTQAVVDVLGSKPSLVVDAVGSDATIDVALEIAELGARVVLVGMAQPNLALSAYGLSTQERSLIGSFCYTAKEFSDTAAWVGEWPQRLGRLIEGSVDLDGAPAAFESLARGDNPASKVLVYPNGVEAAPS